MKSLWVVLVVFFSQSSAFATCLPMDGYKGTYEIVEVSNAQMKCEAKPRGQLQLPGCQMVLRDGETKSEIKVYANPEVCKLQKGIKANMEVSSSCCDVEVIYRCKSFKDGKFKESKSDEMYSCFGDIRKYVSSYSFKKNGKEVFRVYNPIMRSFQDDAIKKKLQTKYSWQFWQKDMSFWKMFLELEKQQQHWH